MSSTFEHPVSEFGFETTTTHTQSKHLQTQAQHNK
jgi:hypothetical protein